MAKSWPCQLSVEPRRRTRGNTTAIGVDFYPFALVFRSNEVRRLCDNTFVDDIYLEILQNRVIGNDRIEPRTSC